MASPQVENGYTKIANEIIETLMRTNLSSYQSRILWAIWRKTYGWNKKEDWISNNQLVMMTGIRKQHVSRTIKELIKRNMVTKSGNKTAFNKDYTQWEKLPKQVTVTNSGNTVTNSGNKVTSLGEHKGNCTKYTLTKNKNQGKGILANSSLTPSFTDFLKKFSLTDKSTVKGMKLFLGEFKKHRGINHPDLKPEQWQEATDNIFYIGGDTGFDAVDLEDLKILVQKYFEKRYKAGCNYSVLHFNSGRVKELLLYENLY